MGQIQWFHRFNLSDSATLRQVLKAGRGPVQPDVWVMVGPDGTPFVRKSWARKAPLWRWLFGRRLARREGRIIAALEDLPGLPRFLGHPDPWTVDMSLLDAEPVPEEKHGTALDALYFARLSELLAAMHRRGINHGDLRRKNLLRAPGDPSTPRLVDFTQCLHFTPPVRGWRRWVLGQAQRVDRVTLLKLKRWFLGPEALDAAERAELAAVPWHLRLGRLLRGRVYRPVKHLLRGGRRRGR